MRISPVSVMVPVGDGLANLVVAAVDGVDADNQLKQNPLSHVVLGD